MEKRLQPFIDVNHPNFKQNIENLESLQRELEVKGLGYFTRDGELVYDSKDENEVFALMDKFILH